MLSVPPLSWRLWTQGEILATGTVQQTSSRLGITAARLMAVYFFKA